MGNHKAAKSVMCEKRSWRHPNTNTHANTHILLRKNEQGPSNCVNGNVPTFQHYLNFSFTSNQTQAPVKSMCKKDNYFISTGQAFQMSTSRHFYCFIHYIAWHSSKEGDGKIEVSLFLSLKKSCFFGLKTMTWLVGTQPHKKKKKERNATIQSACIYIHL